MSRHVARKAKGVAYLGGKCSRCGYNTCFAALEFHHRDASSKEFSMGNMVSVSKERYLAELDKCDLLCANCHREVHQEKSLPVGRN